MSPKTKTISTRHGNLLMDADVHSEINGESLCFSGGYPYIRTKHQVVYKGLKCVAYALVALHRYVVKAQEKEHVDHINGNKMDFRRINLRCCTRAENLRNRPKSKNNSSGYKGIRKHGSSSSWWATIMVNRKRIHLGSFSSPDVAARVYDRAAVLHHKEFANLNFPEDRSTASDYVCPAGTCLSRFASKYGVGVYRSPQGTYYVQAPKKIGLRSTTIKVGFKTPKDAQSFRKNYMEGLT